ncbi:MAG: hypothetical protein P1U62_08960 [Alteraurantiacibacter sp. bin_em_oilr2.035]|nr:hypothetical protein [Alteraurantiacibacter sp. bin_em_oilr2.035]
MARNRNSTARSGSFTKSSSLSAMLDKPNIWSDWLVNQEIGPLSWARLAAILVRRQTPEAIAAFLAPAIAQARATCDENAIYYGERAPEAWDFPVTYRGYRDDMLETLEDPLNEALRGMQGDAEVRWLIEHISERRPWGVSFLWLFLGGIAYAMAEDRFDADKLPENARWLAEIDLPDPRIEPADEYLLRHFYQDLTTRCPRALPLDEFVEPEHNWQDPFNDPSVDDYLSRMAAFERMSIRNLGRLFSARENITDLSEDAWARYQDGSDWDRLLDIAAVPRFDWRRQVAFLLREVPVSELFQRLDRAIMEMEEQTETAVLDQHRDKGKPVNAISFGDWFGQWREHFRHWHDPLRTVLSDLCVGQDADMLAHFLPHMDSAIMANFLIGVCDAYVTNIEWGLPSARNVAPKSDVFRVRSRMETDQAPLPRLTAELWGRFCDKYDIGRSEDGVWCNFDVDFEKGPS